VEVILKYKENQEYWHTGTLGKLNFFKLKVSYHQFSTISVGTAAFTLNITKVFAGT
jgi:hypothetical protein